MTEEERKARHKAANKRYRETHKEKCSAYGKAYRVAHKKPPTPPPTTKKCANCLIEKPRDAFFKIGRITGQRPTRGALGVVAVCKSCKSHLRKPTLLAERAQRAQLDIDGLKVCNVCKATKPVFAFPARRASSDGLGSTCRACANERTVRWKLAHPTAHQEWYRKNSDHKRRYYAKWRAENADRCKATYKRWAKDNTAKINALIAKRTAAKLHATPKWADFAAIEAVYREASRLSKQTGIKHEVDHIVPLQSPHVCGLHVSWNLQVLTKTANISKGNKFTPHTAPHQSTSRAAQL